MLPVAITMGDPTGIGPEILVKLLADPRLDVPVVAIGDAGVLARAADVVGVALVVQTVSSPAEPVPAGSFALVAESALPAGLGWGRVDPRAGRAAFDYVHRGIRLALAGEVSALVTAPISKEALRLAGLPFPGHTEILAHFTGTERYAMMMVNDDLRVLLVTTHEALRTAIDSITVVTELAAIRLAAETMVAAGTARPRVAVAGLNPHAGENGLMGREDIDVLAPAVAIARAEGIDVSGPWPADTVFLRARTGEFDIVVAQYHDQGLIPIKYLGLERGVNVTVGLPFVRTSVDHGTAFDIAGTGKADHTSLLTALQHARALTGDR